MNKDIYNMYSSTSAQQQQSS